MWFSISLTRAVGRRHVDVFVRPARVVGTSGNLNRSDRAAVCVDPSLEMHPVRRYLCPYIAGQR